MLSAATVKPEDVHHVEVGVKTEPFRGVTANVTRLDTEIKDFQTQVVNAERRRAARLSRQRREGARPRRRVRRQRPAERPPLALQRRRLHRRHDTSRSRDAPPPLEETGGPQVKDISGLGAAGHLQVGARRSAASTRTAAALLGRAGEFFAALDASYRSSFSSSASASKYLVVDGYPLLNARVGFRWSRRLDAVALVAQPAEQGLLRTADGGAGQHRPLCRPAGRSRTVGVTLRVALRK